VSKPNQKVQKDSENNPALTGKWGAADGGQPPSPLNYWKRGSGNNRLIYTIIDTMYDADMMLGASSAFIRVI